MIINKIGIFDSGIGGISVLNYLLNKYPTAEYIYYLDNLNFPYGNKTINELKQISYNIVLKLISKGCNLIIIGCNTMSVLFYEDLKNTYPQVFFIPTVPLINNDSEKKIALMATVNTINSEYIKTIKNNNITLIPCDNLADLIEVNDIAKIREYLLSKTNILTSVDTIMLGCTHYSHIKDLIRSIFNKEIIDGSQNALTYLSNYQITSHPTRNITFIISNKNNQQAKIQQCLKYLKEE